MKLEDRLLWHPHHHRSVRRSMNMGMRVAKQFLLFLLGCIALFYILYYEPIIPDFGTQEGHRYFSEDWSRILVLLAIVVVGTPILLGYQTLAAERQRRAALWVVGILAASATGFALQFIYWIARFADFLRDTGELRLGLVLTPLPLILAAFLWWAFSRILHRKIT